MGIASPTTVYETNADKIGLLSDEEVEHVVEYYTRLNRVQEYMELQERMDTTIGMDPLTETFRRLEALLKQFIRAISFDKFYSVGPTDREEEIREQLSLLSDVQDEALDALAENIEHEEIEEQS